MISLNWEGMAGEIGALMSRYNALPRHIAKKHLGAAMKRALRVGLPVLKANTPKGNYRGARSTIKRGEFKTEKKRGGALRRAATVQSKYYGKNKGGYMTGRLGYKFGWESRKAIWLEDGTTFIEPRRMVQKAHDSVKGPVSGMLTREMAKALEKAAAELASGMNPGRK